MNAVFLLLLAGFLLCGILWRHLAPRGSARAPATPRSAQSTQRVAAWRECIKASLPGSDHPDAAAGRRLSDRLRREEQRQRPQERRN
jgi:hypothetical protein